MRAIRERNEKCEGKCGERYRKIVLREAPAAFLPLVGEWLSVAVRPFESQLRPVLSHSRPILGRFMSIEANVLALSHLL